MNDALAGLPGITHGNTGVWSGPTPRALAVYRWVYETTRDFGYQPTVRDVCEHFGFRSTNTVSRYLDPLMRAGYCGRRPTRGGSVRHNQLVFLKTPDGLPFAGWREKDESKTSFSEE